MTPPWPPTTGTEITEVKEWSPRISATKVEARITSKMVTPNSLKRCQDVNLEYGEDELFQIKDTVFFEHFCHDWEGRVDRVEMTRAKAFGAVLVARSLNNSSVDLKVDENG